MCYYLPLFQVIYCYCKLINYTLNNLSTQEGYQLLCGVWRLWNSSRCCHSSNCCTDRHSRTIGSLLEQLEITGQIKGESHRWVWKKLNSHSMYHTMHKKKRYNVNIMFSSNYHRF